MTAAKTPADIFGHFLDRITNPPAPIRLYRFAFGIYAEADELYTLAIIPARSDSEAFDKGCALMPADAPTLARAFWRREGERPNTDTTGAFFTAQEIEDTDQLEVWAADLLTDVAAILERYGQ